ncbi:MAG: lipopolysaccharide biosynthesis protein [Prevotellaceae bacterium]|jgi:O-antigen/teichoic acid export membrane protein|nr:lipopolysaccharide biosynthesis protein [Prevotellaceae bacterium]
MAEKTLKSQTASALVWSAIDKIGLQIVLLIVGIINVRLLSPRDFGLIGALAIFTLLSSVLIESGFSVAMIRRKGNTDAEYSAVFFFNLGISILLYLMLFFSAPAIAEFFRMPELCSLSRFLFLSIILNSLGIVQNIILSIKLSFKLMSIANIVSAIVACAVSVTMACTGWGYWALAWQMVLLPAVKVAILWSFNSWRLSFNCDFRVIRELFSFSSFLLLNSIFSSIVQNSYNILIGRFYRADDLGFYSQAKKYQQVPSAVISEILSGVSYPVLSKLNAESNRQQLYLRKIIRINAFLIFPLMLGMASIIEPLVSIVMTDKWLPAVPYFLCLVPVSILTPLVAINYRFLILKGHPRLMSMLEIAKNATILLSLFACKHSILLMLIVFSAINLLSYGSYLFFVEKKTDYSALQQLKDIMPYAAVAGVMFLLAKGIGLVSPFGLYSTTALQIVLSIAFYFGVLKLLGSQVLADTQEMLRKILPF